MCGLVQAGIAGHMAEDSGSTDFHTQCHPAKLKFALLVCCRILQVSDELSMQLVNLDAWVKKFHDFASADMCGGVEVVRTTIGRHLYHCNQVCMHCAACA